MIILNRPMICRRCNSRSFRQESGGYDMCEFPNPLRTETYVCTNCGFSYTVTPDAPPDKALLELMSDKSLKEIEEELAMLPEEETELEKLIKDVFNESEQDSD